MAGIESRDFDSPDETRTPDKTQVDVVRMGATTAARLAFEPGWRSVSYTHLTLPTKRIV